MPMSYLRKLANEIVEELAGEFAETPDMDLDETIYGRVFDRISDSITCDAEIVGLIGELDLDQSPDGDTLFRALQKAAENKVRSMVEFLVENDERFKSDVEPTP
jgi:hypothetical protein